MEDKLEFEGTGWTLTQTEACAGCNSVLSKQIEAAEKDDRGVTKINVEGDVDEASFAFFLNHIQDENKIKDSAMAFQLLRLGDLYHCSTLADKAFDFLTSQRSKNVLEVFKKIMEYIPQKEEEDLKILKNLRQNSIGWKESIYPSVKNEDCEDVNLDTVRVDDAHPEARPCRLTTSFLAETGEEKSENSEPLINFEDTANKKNLDKLSSEKDNSLSKPEIDTRKTYGVLYGTKWPNSSDFETEMEVTKEMLLSLTHKCFQEIEGTGLNDLDQASFESLTRREMAIVLCILNDLPSKSQLTNWCKQECQRRGLEYNAENERDLLEPLLYGLWSSQNYHDNEECQSNTTVELNILDSPAPKSPPKSQEQRVVSVTKKSGLKRTSSKLASRIGRVLIAIVD